MKESLEREMEAMRGEMREGFANVTSRLDRSDTRLLAIDDLAARVTKLEPPPQ